MDREQIFIRVNFVLSTELSMVRNTKATKVNIPFQMFQVLTPLFPPSSNFTSAECYGLQRHLQNVC